MFIQLPQDALETQVEGHNIIRYMKTMTDDLSARQIQLETEVDNVFQTVSTVDEILNQIQAARNDQCYRISVSADYQRVRAFHFTKYDAMDHFIELQRVPDSPSNEMVIVAHSLPLTGTAACFQTSGSIKNHIATFQLCLEQMESFYEQMHTIDELCLFVHPVVVTTKSNMRTFKLENNIFVKIEVDPYATSSLEITIIGPSYGIGKYRQLYDERIADWDANVDIHQNLLRLFDMTSFPIKSQQQNDADEPHCGICLDYRSELGQIPIVSCDNIRCAIVYHTTCLRNWFQTLPESKTCLDVTFGMCPYCKEKWSTSYVCLLADD